MNITQIKNIEAQLLEIEQLKIENLVAEVFNNQDIENIKIGEFNVPEYVSTLKRLIKQFKIELNDNGFFLPFQYNYQNEYGNGNLTNDFKQIIAQLKVKNHANLNNTTGFINRLVYYQIANGFWDKSTRKLHKPNEIKIVELNDQLNLIAKQLEKYGTNFKELTSELNLKKEDLESFISQKQKELQQITNNLQTSNSNNNQIAQLLNSSTSTNEKINGILQQQNQNLENQIKKIEKQEVNFDNQAERFSNLESSLNEKIKDSKYQVAEFEEKLKFIEDKKAFFEERNNYLDELIGREVGASLFETFKQRKGELENPVNKWLWIVIAMAILTFGAILIIFTNAFGYLGEVPTEISTVRLITNSIKSLPFFLLLFYAIAQYNKERNFQEEYAFKSAVALTIKAYSDLITEETLKDQLIVNSVSRIFKSPSTNKKSNKMKNDTTMMNTAKDLLDTAIEVMKKK
ncbi:hypothetical protein BA195_13795 [Tenacibaculum soleae]|uniref:Uncharacterized protein n=1 Tax=Tenacibaculum soleae TaxID=447689 RepID=A0A1B9XWL2_9FLAO|nr:hypothetical protein [Tenacibaculum soleae]OCK41811.1 hypothetical protein BA195_13795 [Tenacibaculum soleae]